MMSRGKRTSLFLCLWLVIVLRAVPTSSDAANVSSRSPDDDVIRVDDASGGGPAVAVALDDRPGGDGRGPSAAAKVPPVPGNLRLRNSALRKPAGPPQRAGGRDVLAKAFRRAVGGGVPGAVAGMVQVLSLMWLRTVINYQYRYGSSFLQALTTLYGMGGIPRLYSGITFALIQAPLARFVSTAANDGVGALLQHLNWGPGREVVVAALVVGFFRVMLMPIDTCKTVLQIESAKGLSMLLAKVRKGQVHLLYAGALASAAASAIGHYPWFYMYNLLSKSEALVRSVPWATVRNALIGFASSIVSDTVTNSVRVIKTTKQALGSTRSAATYAETISLILAVDGWRGLFGRGLKARILGNALQSILFTVVWRGLSERWKRKEEDDTEGRILGKDRSKGTAQA
ncbi:hypothetical protein ACHAWF_014835 [Thalassiosira exigua]